jgi:mono/diheme cytochrome c family protein
MLRGIDSVLEVLAWSLVVFFAIMLFVGPQVIAEDKPDAEDAAAAAKARDNGGGGGQADESAPAVDGKAVFADACGGCHTLSAAGTSGTTGPNLDDVSLDAGGVEDIVRGGRGSMPSFEGQLSDDEIAAVAEFVASN